MRIVGKVVEAVLAIGAIIGGRLDLGLDLDADHGGRNALDDIGEALHLGRLDAYGIGQNGAGSAGQRANADHAGNGDGSGGSQETLAGAGI
ncbi:hypothetical protein GCM10007881_53960 [Mesorhizobium huakuii]|nr:hypothetical protein GCM10007881_53960 [Mesorhizobium huakuii]